MYCKTDRNISRMNCFPQARDNSLWVAHGSFPSIKELPKNPTRVISVVLPDSPQKNVNDRFNVWNHWRNPFRPTGPPFTSLSTDEASLIKCLAYGHKPGKQIHTSSAHISTYGTIYICAIWTHHLFCFQKWSVSGSSLFSSIQKWKLLISGPSNTRAMYA